MPASAKKKRHYTYKVKCNGTATDGKSCCRMLVYANGRCKAHGGDTPAKIEEFIEPARAAVEKDTDMLRIAMNELRRYRVMVRSRKKILRTRLGW